MKIVATCLVGPGTEHLITSAGLSVRDLADAIIVIDTRPRVQRDADALEGRLAGVGPEVHVSTFKWTGDYSDARNAALAEARRLGADFALTLDTDETIHVDAATVRELLEVHQADIFLLPIEDGHYSKERFLRLASNPMWIGPVHEGCARSDGPTRRVTLPGFFREPAKTPAELEAKFKRDIAALETFIQKDPKHRTTRWYRYLGESNFGLGKHKLAHEWFVRAFQIPAGFCEERAWCCYRSAECLTLLGLHEQALEAGAFTITLDAGYAREAGWICSYACNNLGRHDQAMKWARIAINCPPPENRILPKHLAALRCSYEVLRHSAEQLGLAHIVAEASAWLASP